MAEDIKLIWNNDTMEADIGVEDGDVTHEDGLETAVILSLFTDRRANDDDPLPDPDSTNRRGWWGDQAANIFKDQIGSRLWLLERSKTTEENLVAAKEYTLECLEWMIEDDVAKKIEVNTERLTKGLLEILAIEVIIRKNDGTLFAKTYETQWEGQFN